MIVFRITNTQKEWQVSGSHLPPVPSAITGPGGVVWMATAVEWQLRSLPDGETLVPVITVGAISGGPRVRSTED